MDPESDMAMSLGPRLEEAFGLEFPDEDLVRISTVGDLVRDICARVPRVSVGYCATSRTFFRLRAALMQTVPLCRGQIHPRGDLEELIPPKERRRVWRALRDADIELPALVMSEAWFMAVAAPVIVTAAAAAVWLQSGIMVALIGPLAFLLRFAMRPWAIHFGMCRKVRDAVFHLVPAVDRDSASLLGRSLSDRETAEKIRRIIAEVARVPTEKLSDDARFDFDFGGDPD